MTKLLVTGFEPFGGYKTNSSMLVLSELKQDITKKLLPVTYQGCRREILSEIDRVKPDFVLCLGQAGGETKIRIEKIGINFQGASIPDNEGVLKTDSRIGDGPDGILTHADTEGLLRRLGELGIPAYLSLSAGGYICNTTYYTALEAMQGRALFIHLPFAKGEKEPSMEVSRMVEAVSCIMDELLK